MARPTERNLAFGQNGLIIETEQDPASVDPKACVNAPDGSLKHGLNVDYQGEVNLKRRLGYEDLMHGPELETVQLTTTTVAAPVAEPTTGDTITGLTTGATMRVLSAERVVAGPNFYLVIRGISTNALLFVNGENISDGGGGTLVPDPATLLLVGGVDYTIATYDVQCGFQGAGGSNTGIFCDSNHTWATTRAQTRGIKGAARFTYIDNRQTKSTGFDLERYTVFSTRDRAGYPFAHAYHMRNRGIPNLKQLQIPTLDRLVHPAEFSDVNADSFQAARWWRFLECSRGDEDETYLLGTYGGHYTCPSTVTPPVAWNAAGLGNQPPAGSFNLPACDATAFQRRVLIWFPRWYQWHSTLQGYIVVPEVGLHYWWAPFIWYFDQDVGGLSDFYAEPCGMFIESYNDSIFMARIERTELVNGGTANDSTRWKYEPSGIMWSFWGYITGMELGTPPVYPFSIPNEPRERVWGCAANGFALNRHNYFRRGDGLHITGLKQWNNSLYVMKPNGFGQIIGTYSENFNLIDLEMIQGPCGPYAWCRAEEGIYYCTKRGLFLFDGNPASENYCLSDNKVKKIFQEDIDWSNSTNFMTGEIFSLSMVYDREKKEVLINYAKRGEQGGGGAHDLPAGAPTRMLVFDTLGQRFTEWDLRLPDDEDNTGGTNPGIMLSGKDPTDDDKILLTHPTGASMGNTDGRLLFVGNEGHRDGVTIDRNADPEPLSGNRITYDATSKDHTFGELKSKLAASTQRQIIYANNGGIKRKIIYNMYNENNETELTFGSTADGYYSEKYIENGIVTAGTDSTPSTVAFKYYHDDSLHVKLMITFNAAAPMTATPPIASVLTQAVTGATMTVTHVDLTNHLVYGDDLGTGTWDVVLGHTVTSAPAGILPTPCQPSAVATVVNPFNTNPDNEGIKFVAISVDLTSVGGESKSGD